MMSRLCVVAAVLVGSGATFSMQPQVIEAQTTPPPLRLQNTTTFASETAQVLDARTARGRSAEAAARHLRRGVIRGRAESHHLAVVFGACTGAGRCADPAQTLRPGPGDDRR